MTKDAAVSTALVASEESAVIVAASSEVFTERWPDWNTGDYVGIEPAWSTGKFDTEGFDKALSYWTIKFGNDGIAANEETLKRIKETLVTASSRPATTVNVEKGLANMDLGERIVLVPKTFFGSNDAWVPGAVRMQNRSNKGGSFRVFGALSYPQFSGDGRYAFFQLNHVKSARAYCQLHLFLEKVEGSWRTLAVGRVPE